MYKYIYRKYFKIKISSIFQSKKLHSRVTFGEKLDLLSITYMNIYHIYIKIYEEHNLKCSKKYNIAIYKKYYTFIKSSFDH